MLTKESLVGPWAGLPVAWTEDDQFDEPTYRADVARCCQTDIPGVYTGGTTGEFYALDFDEFQAVTCATVDECHAGNKPVMIGCTATSTSGAARRAAFAAEVGADAFQLAMPYWIKMEDDQVVPFFLEVSKAAGGLPLSIYETTRSKKCLTLDQHRAIKDAVPVYLMVKANAETIGVSHEGCQALSSFVNVFVSESLWPELGPVGAIGSCSSRVYWNPRLILNVWHQLQNQNWPALEDACQDLKRLQSFLRMTFRGKGFTDTAIDRLGALASGFLRTSTCSRGPYRSITVEDVKTLRHWYEQSFPEMLQLGD